MDAPTGTTVEAVLAILDALDRAGVWHSIGGGWGVDALAGRQTRPHSDLDLCIRDCDETATIRALAALGYRPAVDERPTRFALAGPGGASVDVHPLSFRPDGSARLPAPGGSWFSFAPGSLDAAGRIGGRPVRCLTPAQQQIAHQGYEPEADDRHDLALLGDLLGLGTP